MRRLDADPEVELIVVVSKPPDADVATELREYAATLGTPVQLALLGPGQPDLTAAAEAVLDRLGHERPDLARHGHRAPDGRAAAAGCADCSSAAPCATRRC